MNRPYNIPVTKQHLTGKETDYLLDVVNDGVFSRRGKYSQKCERFLSSIVDAHHVFLTPSGSAALSMAGQCLRLGAGDEVIVPTFAFATCAIAFAATGARLVFADSNANDLNINVGQVGELISPNTRAILAIHYAGVACNMNALLESASPHGIPVVEDAAHALFATYSGKPVGSLGAISVLSFDHQKNVSCGQGGALILNDQKLLGDAEVAYDCGTDRAAFDRGVVEKYRWVGSGGNYAMSELQAAFLLAQLEAGTEITARRRERWNQYIGELSGWANDNGVLLPQCSSECQPAAHLFYIVPPNLDMRARIVAALAESGVGNGSHFYPLHLSPEGQRMGWKAGDCPVAERIASLLIRLPLYAALSAAEVEAVCSIVKSAS
jgi:dTDP-4-amino-4,6-dideoxygalactose transaminase